MDSSSAESKSLLDGDDDSKAVGDGAVAGDGALSCPSALPPAASPSPAAATVITVDQATDTSLDNRYVQHMCLCVCRNAIKTY